MSEAIISRRGSGGGSGKMRFVTEFYTFDYNWTVPEGIVNNTISVRIFGGGGAGGNNGGGGSGWMNNGEITVNAGEIIPITVGIAGKKYVGTAYEKYSYSGGTTSFGTYLSANGGECADSGGGSGGAGGGSIRYQPGTGYQFGGGGTIGGSAKGGDGGIYGGGGGSNKANGANGGTYGGGGAVIAESLSSNYRAGNGGTYGGGGGIYGSSGSSQGPYYYKINCGIGGTYGGNGGNHYVYTSTTMQTLLDYSVLANNGTNTSTWTNVFNDGNGYFRGWGRAGSDYGGGGGGYGGNGGQGGIVNNSWAMAGGGGGYGSNGGSGRPTNVAYDNGYGGLSYTTIRGAGGGGGYGGDGGNAGGGGGGYGKEAIGGHGGGGGGGYYARGGNYGGGGGGYGLLVGEFGYGGNKTSSFPSVGRPGICIIQYYIK